MVEANLSKNDVEVIAPLHAEAAATEIVRAPVAVDAEQQAALVPEDMHRRKRRRKKKKRRKKQLPEEAKDEAKKKLQCQHGLGKSAIFSRSYFNPI